MDVDGNRELIYEGNQNIFHALPLRPRVQTAGAAGPRSRGPWPGRALSPRTASSSAPTFTRARPASLRGKAKFLRVLSIDHKTYTYWHQRPYISTGPVVSGVQSDGVKRILGTVPIEADGSVAFRAPAGVAAALSVAGCRAARAADHAQLRQRDAGRKPRLPGLPRTPQRDPAGHLRRSCPRPGPARRSPRRPGTTAR